MLTVYVDQLHAQFPEDRHRNQTAINPADIFAIQVNLTLNNCLRIVFHAIIRKPGKLRHIGKNSPDRCLICTGTNHITIGTLAENGGNRIDHDGFTGTGFTGQDVETLVKGNIRPVDDRNILNMQKTQHGLFLLFLKPADS